MASAVLQTEFKMEDTNGRTLPLSADNSHGSEESSQPKSPLSGYGLFKSLKSDSKRLRADGQPPKRRGPKPDSKPALTRRQELNRQAQRTHRERKELYIKALEQEVLRLKETYTEIIREREAFVEDNKKLRNLLAAHGIACPDELASPPKLYGVDSSASMSVAGNADSAKFDLSPTSATTAPAKQAPSPSPQATNAQALSVLAMLNYDQIGIEFVLALEKPCMDHIQMLCNRSQTSDGTISGHAMMATCPPATHTLEHPDVQYPHKMPDMNQQDLKRLLDLSTHLPLDGEVTPVMAWASIVKDPRHTALTEKDFMDMQINLEAKIRCYGFGAVLEEFEVRDALESVLASKGDGKATDQTFTSQVDIMATEKTFAPQASVNAAEQTFAPADLMKK